MVYASVNDYEAWLQGRRETVPPIEFLFWAARASEQIDLVTFNRLHDEQTLAEYKDEATATTCELAEILYLTGNLSNKKLSSMSIGSYSESYAKEDKEATQKQVSGVIRRGLGMTGLLFRG